LPVPLYVGRLGGAARLVRTVLDVVSAEPEPKRRVPYLYLLDSILQTEAHQAATGAGVSAGGAGAGDPSALIAPACVFPRVVGAALGRLVDMLVTDTDLCLKVCARRGC
jgi:hypothetical protein